MAKIHRPSPEFQMRARETVDDVTYVSRPIAAAPADEESNALPLFAVTTRAGETLSLTVVGRERCVVLRGGAVVETFPTDTAGVRDAVRTFRRLVASADGA